MIKFLPIVILVGLIAIPAQAQEVNSTKDINILERIIIEGDTFLIADIDEVYVMPERKFKNRRERRRYTRMMYNVKKAYPYAVVARNFFDTVNIALADYDTERERKEYLKRVEAELLDEYEDELKKLTITQGRILLKLIDREIGQNSYELLQEYRGNFSAFFWQALARLFGNNLKSEFDPDGEDKLLNEIVIMIERGYI
ncbi:MAG: DUF4294 domain-containing protein [Bacteroidales bacterium]|nr:DUF4294 domain-containing protein [Bacteroidales bacterium]